jgi:flavin-dependent dehydrogenase
MERNQLKVGAGIINSEHELVKRTEPIKNYIELIIKDYMKIKDYKIIDIHGSTLKYSKGLKDIYYKDNLIAIGDAVSTVNFLGGEGIRHAMYSAEVACKHIKNYLNNDLSSFRGYQREVRRNFYVRWKLSEILGRKKYLQQSDRLIDKSIGYSKFLTVEDLIDILFYYKFEKVIYYKLLKIPLALSQRFRDFQKRNDP